MRSTPVQPVDEFRLLAYSQIFSDLGVPFVTPRHFQNVHQTSQSEKESPSSSPS